MNKLFIFVAFVLVLCNMVLLYYLDKTIKENRDLKLNSVDAFVSNKDVVTYSFVYKGVSFYKPYLPNGLKPGESITIGETK